MSKDLQTLNKQNKAAQWAERIAECRNSGQTVKTWCKEHDISEPTYYKWQRQLFEAAKAAQEPQFVEVTPVQASCVEDAAVTVRIAGMEAVIQNGVDTAIVETVLRFMRSC